MVSVSPRAKAATASGPKTGASGPTASGDSPSTAATGTTVAGIFAYRLVGPLNDKIGRKPVFMLGAAGYAAYFTTIYFVTNVAVVTILWILPIYPLIQSAAAALMSDYTSAADRGKGLGLLESAISLGGGLGPLAGGLIADAAQLQAVIFFSLAVALA